MCWVRVFSSKISTHIPFCSTQYDIRSRFRNFTAVSILLRGFHRGVTSFRSRVPDWRARFGFNASLGLTYAADELERVIIFHHNPVALPPLIRSTPRTCRVCSGFQASPHPCHNAFTSPKLSTRRRQQGLSERCYYIHQRSLREGEKREGTVCFGV